MRKKITVCSIFVMVLFWTVLANAQNLQNQLIGIKALPLPDNSVRIIFQFSSPVTKLPSNFTMKNPAMLVFDFSNTGNQLNANLSNATVGVGALNKYSIVTGANRLRAVLDLSKLVGYTTAIQGNEFNVTLTGNSAYKKFDESQAFYSQNNAVTRFTVNSVDFRGADKKGGKLVIQTSSPNAGIDVQQEGSQLLVKLSKTKISADLLRRLDVVDFHTPAQMISAYQKGSDAQFVIDTVGDYGYFSYQVDKTFYIEIFPSTEEEIKRAKLTKEVYSGKRISFNFQNISVRAVLQLIAEFTQQNIVVSDGVKGNITLNLNKVPWDEALSIILKTRGLSKRKVGDVLLIAPSAEISASEASEIEAIEKSKELAPLLSELMQINYAKASELSELLGNKDAKMLSERGAISVDARTNSIWLQDTAAKLSELKALIKKLDVPVSQVLIEARVVIINRNFEQDLGIRFGVTKPDSLSGTIAGANEINGGTAPSGTTTVNGVPTNRLNLDLAAAPIDGTAASIGLALAKLGHGVLLDLELSALEIEGKGEVISSPRLITANQQKATIMSGEEIPYQESSSSGATTVAFKKAVLQLEVTPQITPDNSILLDLKVNQDARGIPTPTGVPIILTKQISTNVLVSNGQTIVLGGIYKQNKTQSISRVPFLGEMPFIGPLFRKKQQVIQKEELLIFITPKIIKNSFMTS